MCQEEEEEEEGRGGDNMRGGSEKENTVKHDAGITPAHRPNDPSSCILVQ